MRLIGCVRVSRVGGRVGQSFISPDVQREQMQHYASAMGHTIVGFHDDLDQPGSTLNRPGLQAALEQVRAGDADGIIAAKLDRLTRSIADLGALLRSARDEGWNLVAVDVGLDLGTPNGRLVAHVVGAVAEWELERRRTDWKEARARAVGRGVHVASRTPTGYQRGPDGVLEPDPETSDAVRELFARRERGDGWGALAEFMTGTGVVTPYGNEVWTAAAVRKVVRNRVYLGEARSGEYVHQSAHEPLVARAEWEAAQMPGLTPQARSGDPLLLSGLVRCASCRYVAKADSMRDRDGSRLGMYRCRGKHAAGKCPNPVAVLSRVLDPIVEEQLLAWLRQHDLAADASAAAAELDVALAELDAAEAELMAYVASETLAIAGREAYEHGLAARSRVVDAAQERVVAARSRVVTIGKLTPLELAEAWNTFTRAEQREVVAAALDCVVVYPHQSGHPPSDRVRLILRGDGPDGLPQRGRRVPLAPWPADGERDAGMAAAEDAEERLLD